MAVRATTSVISKQEGKKKEEKKKEKKKEEGQFYTFYPKKTLTSVLA